MHNRLDIHVAECVDRTISQTPTVLLWDETRHEVSSCDVVGSTIQRSVPQDFSLLLLDRLASNRQLIPELIQSLSEIFPYSAHCQFRSESLCRFSPTCPQREPRQSPRTRVFQHTTNQFHNCASSVVATALRYHARTRDWTGLFLEPLRMDHHTLSRSQSVAGGQAESSKNSCQKDSTQADNKVDTKTVGNRMCNWINSNSCISQLMS